ncbi:LRC40 protein, partial [Polyodon spathula]|nr:LRC40 protein [Polyodon spathula]
IVLPPSVSQMTQLKKLFLNDNKLLLPPTEVLCRMNLISLPSSLRKLRQLQKTGARNNHIATLPTEFVQLKALQWLNLANNELSDLPKNFMNLEVLAYLNLDGNTFLESLSGQ